jgi:hypothetical protein
VIDYEFPPNSTTTITVEYISRLFSHLWDSEAMQYNNFPLFNDGFYTESHPEYSIEIENRYVDEGRPYAEFYWISDIYFTKKSESTVDDIYMCYELIKQASLNNDLYSIQKTGATTWKINFSQKFVDHYKRYFAILLNYWGSWEYSFCKIISVWDANLSSIHLN